MKGISVLIPAIIHDLYVKSINQHNDRESCKVIASNSINADGQHKSEITYHRWTIRR